MNESYPLISKSDPQVLDGTIVAYQPVPQQGSYVTVADRDGTPTIVAFDLTDLAVLQRAMQEALSAPDGTDPDDLARITRAGMTLLPDVLGLDREEGEQ